MKGVTPVPESKFTNEIDPNTGTKARSFTHWMQKLNVFLDDISKDVPGVTASSGVDGKFVFRLVVPTPKKPQNRKIAITFYVVKSTTFYPTRWLLGIDVSPTTGRFGLTKAPECTFVLCDAIYPKQGRQRSNYGGAIIRIAPDTQVSALRSNPGPRQRVLQICALPVALPELMECRDKFVNYLNAARDVMFVRQL